MHRIDDKKVILGGLAAGLVLLAGNLILGRIAGTELVAAIAGDTTRSMNPAEMWGYAWAHVLIGTIVAWVYAALAPFYGTGVRAAARAGLAVWVVAMPAPMAFQVILHVVRPGLEGGSMLVGMAVSAALFALAGLASAGVGALSSERPPLVGGGGRRHLIQPRPRDPGANPAGSSP